MIEIKENQVLDFQNEVRKGIYNLLIQMKKHGILVISVNDDGTKLKQRLKNLIIGFSEDKFNSEPSWRNLWSDFESFLPLLDVDELTEYLFAIIESSHSFWSDLSDNVINFALYFGSKGSVKYYQPNMLAIKGGLN